MAPPPISFNPEKQWTQADFPLKKITIAGALEGNISGGTPTKMIVIADGDFAINGGGQNQQPERLNPDNVNMFVNCIDWLSDDTGLIELRTKTVMSRPIKDLEDGTRSFLKWLNFLLPILLVIAYGVFRMQQRRAIRVKRQEENYG